MENFIDLSLYFNPCNQLNEDFFIDQRVRWGRQIDAFADISYFPDWTHAHIALLGVSENRNSTCSINCEGADIVRKHLYNLFPGKFKSKIVDLGNLKTGNTPNDTYFILKEVVCALLSNRVIPIIIGGSQDLTFANYQAYEQIKQIINIGTIDSTLDLGDPDAPISSTSYMSKIIVKNPNFLFNYINMGYQTYLSEQEAIELMNKLYFEAYRYGTLRNNLLEIEPLMRCCDCLSVDMSAVRKSDSPGNSAAYPTGFSAEDICQIMRFAGMSDQISSLGLYEYHPSLDSNEQSAMLLSEMIWCFVDGYEHRKKEHPYTSSENYKRYTVTIRDSEHDLIFLKSKESDRWWMELPCSEEIRQKFSRHYLVPCSYKDYQDALNNEIPDKWWGAYRKLI
ncbi:MAG: formimidoylglutamase [Bacteroidales bacterium]